MTSSSTIPAPPGSFSRVEAGKTLAMSKKRNNRISNGAVKYATIKPAISSMMIIPGSFWPRISAPWVDSHIAQQIDPIKVTTARGKQRPFDLTQEKAEWLQEFQWYREATRLIVNIKEEYLGECRFVKLRGTHGWGTESADLAAETRGRSNTSV